MSLARSASGPGGLTINTGAANSLVTTSTQQPAAGGLFGSGSASANPTTSTSGGMSATGGLFGGAQQKPATGLFGSSTTTSQPAAGGGLFGSRSATTQQGQQNIGGGLFGSNASSSQPQQQQQQQPAGSGLFGSTANTQQQQTQQPSGGGLFGNTSSQQPQPQQQAGGLFGQSNQQQQPQTGGGLFGASTTNTQPTGGGGLFGQSQAKPSGGLFGQTQTQQTQSTNQVPAVQINYDYLRPRTRFDDLARPVQDEIALIDKGIQRVIKMKDEIGEFMPQHEKDIEQLGRDVKFVESKFRAVQVALNRDIQTVKVLQDMTKKSIADAQLSFKATDNLKLPTHYHQTGLFAGPPPSTDSSAADASAAHTNAQDLITYFNRICDDVEKYKKRLDEYRGEIERDMPGVEHGLYEQIRTFRDRNSAAGGAVQDQLGQVLSALRETANAIVAQAGQIADTRERLSRLQAGILDSGIYAMGMTA
ncbi:Nucleoporin NUP49/NSP49 [Tolypocladium ophioglossoides CBS 100239]|uniref:Nucleoporin NUP49/NSP49 n=1 Tax=Tolypocladium ophioglossoides (strain CBS 100239) TaxID=1163406 RepID=A0A0L0NBL8_TOLOC|nr:Nucleoporin NUP49/NSP49 [Tolypocladium ophioglossoides CBS 100239]